VEEVHLVARREEEELMNSILEEEVVVWMTFSRCVSIPKIQMVISIQGDGCRSRSRSFERTIDSKFTFDTARFPPIWTSGQLIIFFGKPAVLDSTGYRR
jgi:hypothetical protein